MDLKKIFSKAKETNTALEINAFPTRLDLRDVYIKEAIQNKVKLIISTDAHSIKHLDFMKFGIFQARRAGARKQDILNTLPYNKFIKSLEKN